MEKMILNFQKTKILLRKNNFLKKSRPISRILSTPKRSLIIYLGTQLLTHSIFLPFDNGREPLNVDILEISPHRVYLVSLQHYLYILSVALVLSYPETSGQNDGSYPLCFSVVSGLSFPNKLATIRRSAWQK